MGRFAISMLLTGVLCAVIGLDAAVRASSPDPAPSVSPVPCPVAETQAMAGSRASPAQVGIGGRVEAPKAGFALTLPDGWLWAATESSDFEALSALVIGTDAERGPAVAGLLSALPCTHTYLFDLVAVAPVLKGEAVAETCSVGISPATGESMEEILELNMVPTISLGGEARTSYPVDLPAGTAGRVDSVHVLDVETLGDVMHYGSRYFWLADGRQSMLSCLDVLPHPDHWLPIAETFEFLTEEEG